MDEQRLNPREGYSVDDCLKVIAVLVHQMGGAATIQAHELERSYDMTMYRVSDPFALKLVSEVKPNA